MTTLQEEHVANSFAENFCCSMMGVNLEASSVSELWDAAKTGMSIAAESLPETPHKANHSWISSETLSLIGLRRQARLDNDNANEQRLHKQTRKSAKLDRARWLNALIANGGWDPIRKLRKPRRPKCGRLKDQHEN